MDIVSRDSFEMLLHLRREVERLFGEFYNAFGNGQQDRLNYNVSVDVIVDERDVLVTVELPGIRKTDLHIQVEKGCLEIKGIKREESKPGKARHFYAERTYGKFNRTIHLPAACDTRKATALFVKGILYATIPRILERRENTREIEVSWEE